MSPLPAPGGGLPPSAPLRVLRSGQKLVRFYRPRHGAWNSPRFFGPLRRARFDHHRPPIGIDPERSVWYAARSLTGATAEAFGNSGFLDKASERRVVMAEVRDPLRLVELAGTAARTFGLDQRIGTSTAYGLCQSWARAFYEHYGDLDGIHWRGRQAGSLCVVLTDRANLSKLEVLADHDISEAAVWRRIVRAASRCRLRILGA